MMDDATKAQLAKLLEHRTDNNPSAYIVTDTSTDLLWQHIYTAVIIDQSPAIIQFQSETGKDMSDRVIQFAADLADKAVAVAKERRYD